MDQALFFAEAQDMSSFSTGANASEVQLDLMAADVDWNVAGKFMLEISIDSDVTSGGAATVDFQLQDSADDSSWSATDLTSGAIGKATLVEGYQVMLELVPRTIRRYVRINAQVGTAALTGGAYSARLVQAQ